MTARPFALALYAVTGTVFLVTAAIVVLMPAGILPAAVEDILMNIGHNDVRTMHIVQEFGSLAAFAGLTCFWFVRRYGQSYYFHWALTVFFALFALAHWVSIKGDVYPGNGKFIDSVPFILFALIGLFRWKEQRATAKADAKHE